MKCVNISEALKAIILISVLPIFSDKMNHAFVRGSQISPKSFTKQKDHYENIEKTVE